MMNSPLHEVQAIFEAVCRLSASARTEWFTQHATEASVRTEVEELLRYDGLAEEEAFFAPKPARGENDSLIGTKVGPYEIVSLIGRGGMGSVYQAHRRSPYVQEVAIKVADLRLGSGAERFHEERQVLADLDHPGIAKLLDGGVLNDDRPYLVMEYVPGEHVDAYAELHKLRVMELVQLWLKVCEAVASAHQRGIIHRDLKPSNILVTKEQRVVVVDFGLARRWEKAGGLTRTAMVLGTPDYMAPEQATGKKLQTTPATDVYALGAVLYTLLTGRPPFRAESPLQLVTLLLSDDPVSPRRLNPAVPRDLETICLKCLEKEPGKRYASATELRDDVFCLVRGGPIRARSIGFVGRSWRWAIRRPALACLIALLFATIAVSLMVVVNYWRTSKNALQLTKLTTREQFLGIVELAKQPAMQRAQADFLSSWVASQEKLVRSLDDEPIYLQFLRARHELATAYIRIGQEDKAKVIAEQLYQEIEAYSQSHYSDELAIEHAKYCMLHLMALPNPEDPQVRCQQFRKAIGILSKVPPTSHRIEETLGLIADYRTKIARFETDSRVVESELNEAHRILAQLIDPKDPQSRIRFCLCKLTIWEHYFNKGEWLHHQDMLKDAAELDRQLGKDFPLNPEYRDGTCAATIYWGYTLEWSGEWQSAYDIQLEITSLAVQMQERNPDTVRFISQTAYCHQILGQQAYALGKKDLAEKHYSLGLELYSKALTKVQSLSHLMVFASFLLECPILKLRDEKRALEMYHQALAQNPDDKFVWLYGSRCLLRFGQYQQARKAIEDSLTKLPTDFERAYAHCYLALTLAKMGEHELASKELTLVDSYRARYPKEIVMMWLYEEAQQLIQQK